MLPAMSDSPATFWRKCSTCKGPIGFGKLYWICNVSTCSRRDTNFAFCQVPCWDAHLPTMNHRNAWAVEKTAPTESEFKSQAAQEPAPRAPAVQSSSPPPKPIGDVPHDILIVASKLKNYVRAKTGLNTSADVMEALSDIVRRQTDEALIRARQAGRKTLMGRDFR